MRSDIAPSVQRAQVLESSRVRWVGRCEIQPEAKAFEILLQVLQWRKDWH
jgi:hypothetical protein